MGKSPPKHDARAVVREYIKRFGDPDALEEDKGVAKNRSYRWQEDLLSSSLLLSMTLHLSRRRCVLVEVAKRMPLVTT